MPIVRTYGDPGIFGMGAFEAGRELGRANRLAQQRQIDAQFTSERLAAQDRMREMGVFESFQDRRARQQGSGSGFAQENENEATINEFARQLKKDRETEALAKLEKQEEARNRKMLIEGLDKAYSGREKDFAYYYARDQINQGEKLNDRMQAALGIETPSEIEAKNKRLAKEQEGQVEDFAPKTDTERGVRRSIQQGRVGDVVPMLDDRDKSAVYGEPGPLSTKALAARTQLAAEASAISDRETLETMRKDMKASGASEDALGIIDRRIGEVEEEDTKVKAPAAFEQVVSTFQGRLRTMQAAAGRPLDTTERRVLLTRTIKETRESFGLTSEQFAAYIRQDEERRRMAALLVEQAQQSLENAVQATTAPNAQGQQSQTQPPAPRKPDFGQRGAPS